MICIPMAGRSKRFLDAGYLKPKFMLDAHGRPLFDWAVCSFTAYFASEPFLFICLNDREIHQFIEERCTSLGIKNFKVICLDTVTSGQAETCYRGLTSTRCDTDQRLLIFNIDTIRFNFRFQEFNFEPWGYLECFIGAGDNWSNVISDSNEPFRVLRTSEKLNESELCCTGAYFFSKAKNFLNDYEEFYLHQPSGSLRELETESFVAPMYNNSIEKGRVVKFTIINNSDIVFCGTPSEYQEFCNRHAV